MRFLKPLIVFIFALAGAFFLSAQFPVKLPPVEVAAEPLPLGKLPLVEYITNTLLSTWVVMVLLVILAAIAMRRRDLVPSGWQNLVEALVEALWNLTEEVAGPKRGAKFFPVVATFFFFILLSNWLGLIPGVGSIGFLEHKPHGQTEESFIVPLLRAPSTDLNTTVGLALVSVILTQVFGMQALGVFGYWGKFFNFRGTWHLIEAILGLKPRPTRFTGYFMLAFNAFLDLFVGLLELISEFAKIISFSFRLFGNIFAGEVLLAVIAYLIPYLLPLPFLGLEVFVGFIQAFIFYILSLVFMTIATMPHGGEGTAH